ncbi:MAG TPA: BamA/TamA family outer membrane protein [Gemmatimonadales bacterium]|nr:BamA/TamA family outer membrane protein [Gemmatimonadales bacterium]
MRARYFQPAEYEARNTYVAAADAAVGFTARGGRYAVAQFQGPLRWPGWRFQGGALAERLVRFGYFGLGNDTEKDSDLLSDDDPFLYRVRRIRYRGEAEVTRRIHGPLQVALQGAFEQVRFTTLPGPSLFQEDFGEGIKEDDATARLAVVYDTRDNEYNTHRGLLLEAGALVGSGNDGYTRIYSILRGYLMPREGTVIAARLAGSGMGGTPTLNARYTLPGWERGVTVVGGEWSQRAFDTGRFAGEGALFGNLEVRHDLLPLGDLGAVTLLGFIDAGRVFEGESFRLTTEDLHVGGGGGFAVRVLRSTIFVFNFAGGGDEFNFTMSTSWMF